MFNLIKTQWVGIIAVIVICFIFVGSPTKGLGAIDRSTISNPWTFSDTVTFSSTTTTNGLLDASTFVEGGGVTASSTPTSSTLLYTAFDTENVIDHTLTQSSGTLTLPATSTITGMSTAGDTRTIYIRNATTSASVSLTIAVGTGMTLKNAASSTATLIGDTDGGNTMQVILVRKANSDINAYLMKYQD